MSGSARERAFGSAPFRYLLAGQMLSTLGDQFYAVALPILLLAKGGGATALGEVLAAFGVCRAAALLPGGFLVDRLGATRVMLASDLARTGTTLVLALLAFASHPPLWAFLLIGGALGTGSGFFHPGFFAATPRLVPPGSLQSANASLQGSLQAVAIVGPAVGGVVVTALHAGWAFAADAVSFAASALSLVLILAAGQRQDALQSSAATTARLEQATRELVTDETRDASLPTLRALWREFPLLRVILLLAVVLSLVFGGTLDVALPSLAEGPLQAGARGYGFLLAAFGLGALLGAVLSAHVGRRKTGAIVALAIGGQGAALAALAVPAVLGASGGMPVIAAVLAGLAGVANGLGNTLLLTLFQAQLPPAVIGRVMGTMLLANYGLYPVSTFLAGVAIPRLGVAAYFIAAGALEVVVILTALASAALRHASLPGSESDPQPESGS